MNNTFIFKTNLNDIFTSNDIKNSEKTCDYCLKRKRICKCDTIRKGLGSEKIQELTELESLRKSYDEICERIAEKYSDVINRFEYDKDLVRFVKKYKINDEIENEEWFYLYEVLKDRNIIERFVEMNTENAGKKENFITLNSFHFDEEANYLSCLNYYLKINEFRNIKHSWMGMSENPLHEYMVSITNSYGMNEGIKDQEKENYDEKDDNCYEEKEKNAHQIENTSEDNANKEKNKEIKNTESFSDEPYIDSTRRNRTFFPLYYTLYIQENERWINGLNNSGDIISHPDNIDYVWNKTVREGNKIKLFHLITANSIKRSPSDYYKFEKNKQKNDTVVNSSTVVCNNNSSNITDVIDPFVMDEILCLSHIICGLGMLNIGGFFIIKTKILFDNLFLSIFSILSICFKKLEIYRPSSCYSKNVVFLIGVEFNGISSMLLSTLTGWIKATQREMLLLLGEAGRKKKQITSLIAQKYHTNRSVIPKKWIKNIFFQEYKNCINYFIDYLIYHLKNCINISNINLNRGKIENMKNYYISQFFEKNKIAALDKNDKLLHDALGVYKDKEILNYNYLYDMEGNFSNEDEETLLIEKVEDSENNSNSSCEINYSLKKSAFIKKEYMRLKNAEIFFNSIEMPADSKTTCERFTKEIIYLLKRIRCKKEKEANIEASKSIRNDTNVIDNEETKHKEADFFKMDSTILQNRVFYFFKKNAVYLKEEEKFINLLQHQKYFSSKSWFRPVLRRNISNFEKSFYLKKKIFINTLKCRNYLYHQNCHTYVNSIKQLLVQHQPLRTSYIKYNLGAYSIDLLFVLKNCANLDIFSNSESIANFLVISKEDTVYHFLLNFEKGVYVSLMPNSDQGLMTEDSLNKKNNGKFFVNVAELYEQEKSYKHFSELLMSVLKQKNVCSFIYIDLNDYFVNYVHILQKELKGKFYFIASLIIGLNYLKKNGLMIIRLNSILTFFSAGFVYLLFCAFENVQFFIPPSCDDIDLVFFLCCSNFNGNFIYRHYVQYIWDYLICNKYVDSQKNSSFSTTSITNKNKRMNRNENKKCDIFFSVPCLFIMNKHFVKFLKYFNSYYFKGHINACLNFLKQPKIFHGNKTLGKYILAHFFQAHIIHNKSFYSVCKSLTLSTSLSETEETYGDEGDMEESTEIDFDRESDVEEEMEYEDQDEIIRKGITYGENIFMLKNEIIDTKKRKLEFSSSESNYSITYEFENVPSEISVSDSAWASD